jgi:putative ATP-dependent endonuclease of the OLD family
MFFRVIFKAVRISRVRIENFRNFKLLDVELGQNIILVGESKAGKSNFIEALRLVLDPSLSDSERQLTEDDFWDGDEAPPFNGRQIKIEVQFTDFANEGSPEYLPLSWLSDCFVTVDSDRIAQLSYIYCEDATSKDHSSGQDDYTFKIYPGDNPNKPFNIKGMRKDIPLCLIEALRDIAGDNKAWNRSPLKRLLKLIDLPLEQLQPYADEIKKASERVVAEVLPLKNLETEIKDRLDKMIGSLYQIDPQLGLNATTPQTLLEALRVFADGAQRRSLDKISLGLQNVLYLSLLSLMLEKQQINRIIRNEAFLPIVALEEPESHLHPHLQRLVFRDFLNAAQNRKQPVLISTHSPHLVSATSVKDLVLLKDCGLDGCKAVSAYKFVQSLDDRSCKDLERFLDVTKSEMIFSKGVIFVEGDVEVLLTSEFAEILGKSLDKFGISICNVYGTHFGHVVTLAHEFGIPFIVLTDGDKFAPVNGLQRAIKLLQIINPPQQENLLDLYNRDHKEKVRSLLQCEGIFVNDWTLEPSLLEAGLANELKLTFDELGEELGAHLKAGKKHVDSYLLDKTDENIKNILTAIADTRWGKGRFAQRLVSHIRARGDSLRTQDEKNAIVPEYIRIGIEFLVDRVKFKQAEFK